MMDTFSLPLCDFSGFFRLNKTESSVFLYCRFSLFLKDPFFPDYLYEFCQFGMKKLIFCVHFFPIRKISSPKSVPDAGARVNSLASKKKQNTISSTVFFIFKVSISIY